ncbi:acyl-CoA dehydrogenase family protein [Bacillus sp. 2205SS5-2]|uniref:acyl-CoA dehydrogenase family protein n=1 Tax=Bacillus sp. 2205SS5-2 TaxID=3109031 RepID=UPI00300436E7
MGKTNERVHGSHFLLKDTSLNRFFTPEDFTDEQLLIAKTAQKFIEKEVIPCKEKIENQDFSTVVSLLKRAGDIGLLAHSIPEQYGGLGLDKVSKGIVGEMIGPSSGYGVAHANHTCIATLPITYFGTPKQKSSYLPKMASGEYIGAYCLTEANAGSDALAAETTAVLNEKGTHYLLNGTKIYITNAAFSHTFIVYAKVDGQHFSAFIVERNFPGLSIGPEEKKMGIKGSSTCSVLLEDCEVPAENLLGEVGKGHIIALNVLNLGRFNLGSACMGGAKAGFKKTIKFINERIQFNSKIADFPASKEKVAKMAARLYATESLQYRTAGLLEDALGSLDEASDQELVAQRLSEYATECAICKVYGSETLDFVADEALQLHGGAGFMQEYGIDQMYRDSRINRIFEGTNEINRLLIPTHLFRKSMRGEISLQSNIEAAWHQLENPVGSYSGLMIREQEAVDILRHLFLVCAGIASEKFGVSLVKEQEMLIKLADMAIALFAGESVVYRTLKSIECNGENRSELKMDLTRTTLEESMLVAEQHARWIISILTSGEKLQHILSIIFNERNRYTSFDNAIFRNRRIAEKQYEMHSYVC